MIYNNNKDQHIGVWVTKDGYIRHELLPNGRYVEARGNKKNAFTGFYNISGKHIEYLDDSGFVANGDFEGNVFYHAGMVLYKESA